MLTRILIGVGLLVGLTPVHAQDATKLHGTWVVQKSEEAPQGTRLEFTAGGKVVLTMKMDGKNVRMEGTFSVSGDTLTMKISHEGRERTDVRTIRSVSKDSLVTVNARKRTEELVRDDR